MSRAVGLLEQVKGKSLGTVVVGAKSARTGQGCTSFPGICTKLVDRRFLSSSDDGTHAIMPLQIARPPGLARADSDTPRTPSLEDTAAPQAYGGALAIQRHLVRDVDLSLLNRGRL